MKEHRISLWDNARFLLILLVVMGHMVSEYINGSALYRGIFMFIYVFHMPAFLFISGMFHRNDRIARKVLFYVTLHYILKVMVFVIRLAFGVKLSFTIFSEASYCWYPFALAAFILITWLVRDLNPSVVLGLSLVIGCLAGYDSSLGDVLCSSRILTFFPFYFAGTLVSRSRLEEMNRRTSLRIAGFLILAVWALICVLRPDTVYIFRPFVTGRNPIPEEMWNYGFLVRAGMYVLGSVLTLALILITPARRLPAVTVCGQRTLPVYIWHRAILLCLSYAGLCARFCEMGAAAKLVWLLLTIPFTLLTALPIFCVMTDRLKKRCGL